MMSGRDAAVALLTRGADLLLGYYATPLPVVVACTGHALAGGALLLMTGDVRLGAQGAFKIGLNEVAIGMPVPSFGVELCRDRLSPAWFTRCVQHATLCTPTDAVAAGFLDEVVALDAVPERTLAVATQLAETVHPGPFRMTRETIRGELHEELKAGLERDLGAFSVSG